MSGKKHSLTVHNVPGTVLGTCHSSLIVCYYQFIDEKIQVPTGSISISESHS